MPGRITKNTLSGTAPDKPLTKDQIIQHLIDGWELGYSDGIRGPGRYWVQKKLMAGGESKTVHGSSVHSLWKSEYIKISRKADDPFWLRRYVLTGKVLCK